MIKLGISGACGKMGKRIIALANQEKDVTVILGFENKEHPDIGKIIDGVKISADISDVKDCDCLIEFSAPEPTIEHIPYLIKHKKCAVIGTTGLNDEQQNIIKKTSESIPIVFSPNMSIGVNLLFKLVKLCAETLKNYNIYIEETHHIHKKDAPSGTAKKIAQIINESGFNIKTKDIKAIREDEIAGDHKIIFESDVDKIELFHSAKTRDIFAQGAIIAAKWVVNKKHGLYSMDNVLFKIEEQC